MKQREDYQKIWSRTQDVYRRKGLQYDAERNKGLLERRWLERFEGLIPKESAILDAGCGGGEPIAQYFLKQGHSVTGFDFSVPLIELAKKRFPEGRWLVADMRCLNLGEQFNGIIAWHSFFHLNPDEQRTTLKLFAEHLLPEGILLLTIGPTAGEVLGKVGGEDVYHSSLAIDEYQDVLGSIGIEVVEFVPEDPECDFASVLLARKSA